MTSAASGSSDNSTIRSILRAGDYFQVLDLPKPYVSLSGDAVWDCGSEAVNRAFRKRSLHCHPDKSRHPDAPRAFDTLKKAKACLLNEMQRDGYVREHVREQQLRWEGSWKSEAEAAQAKAHSSEVRANVQQHHADNVAEAMRKRREKAEFNQWKRERSEQRRARVLGRRLDEEERGETLAQDDESDESINGGSEVIRKAPVRGMGGEGGATKRRRRFGF
eukprot:scaffold299200_cov27-Tisochrysis_lutea.AAC.1